MKLFKGFLALFLIFILCACSTPRVLVTNCEAIGQGIYDCEKVKDL